MVGKGEMATAMTDDIVLGFDPGGESAFGAAVLSGSRVTAGTVSSVQEAMDVARTQCGSLKVVAARRLPPSGRAVAEAAGHPLQATSTIARVTRMLGEDETWLQEISLAGARRWPSLSCAGQACGGRLAQRT
jgi:hypothetical protein